MKSLLNLAMASVLAAAAVPSAYADTQTVDRIGVPARIRCGISPEGTAIMAEHADKIVFHLLGILPALDPADQAALDRIPRNSKLDIKVLDNPLVIADLKGKVLSFIGAMDVPFTREQLVIDEVLYAMVCPTRPGATWPGEF